ncbi:MAG: hypothetical protein JW735_02080 [Prolixibacteraceae bacterium]|jgi:hypothetical protein|nr:hypothetical protein [Prolixibacteraceae bacterium]
MKPETISTIKKELLHLPPDQLVEFCIRMAKYKVENKELLSYLIYESADQALFIEEVKKEIDLQFKNLNKSQHFLAKKTVRKVLRTTLKYIKFSGEKTTELELLIYFCKKLRLSGLSLRYGTVLGNLYMRQHQRAQKVLGTLHEDLQMDYADEMARIS